MWLRPRPIPTGQLDQYGQSFRRIEELTRRQMARRLHDGPSQLVSALAMRVDITRRQLASSPATADAELGKLEELARRTARDLRHLQFTLIPQSLEVAGLETAWQDLVRQLQQRYERLIEIEIQKKGIRALNVDQQQLLFYIGSEGLDNACRHAEAATIKLSLTWPEADVVLLEIDDDGKGFDYAAVQQTAETDRKYGLAIMHERVKLLPGELSIQSEPNGGTKLRVALIAARGRVKE